MKQICFVVKNINIGGGISRVVSYLSNELSKDREVTILSIEKKFTVNKRAYELDNNVNVHYLTEEVISYRREICTLSKQLKIFLKKHRFDSLVVAGMDFVPLLTLSINYLKKENVTIVAWEHANYKVGKKFGLK